MPPNIGLCAQIACVWEATARKPGNVHRYRDFDDVTYLDFILSAAAIAPVLASAVEHPVGKTVLDCVQATQQVTATNTNLGIILLLAPLAAMPANERLELGVERILSNLNVEDARLAYQAIRLAKPGGLNHVPEQDVAAEPTRTLREVMTLAAERDLVARQYANSFREVFDVCVPALTKSLELTGSIEEAIVLTHLHLMANLPDTLIARKRGASEAEEASKRAQKVLEAGWPQRQAGHAELKNFDAWLRAEGNQRNPGSTADLLAAGLFVQLREELLALPLNLSWMTRDSDPRA